MGKSYMKLSRPVKDSIQEMIDQLTAEHTAELINWLSAKCHDYHHSIDPSIEEE